ncbi:AAA family ATPase [Shumkonia mesophila]|uniref:AAA family ATPase n=1 Tax=Shumkonia mesophila TaxID=2838854 RepID=UPI002934A075|nr:AAA family ATPase [Shumkonia mesophila]
MDVRVLGWRYENIRGDLRDIEIDLALTPNRWTLIQMPNGTGKTTTMSLFRAIFAGEALTPQAVRNFRAADNADTGLFEVRLTVDGRPFRLQLKLDYRDGSHSYWTARSEVRSGGLDEGLSLPTELRRLLTPEFSRLFIFDGELAKEIRTVGKERAADAIRTLYGLDRLADLSRQIDRLVGETQQRAAAVSTASELKGVRRWRNAYDAAVANKERLTQQHLDFQKQHRDLEARGSSLTAQISGRIQQDETLKKRKQQLDEERERIDRAIFELTAQGMSVLRAPAKLHPRILDRLRGLGGRLTHLKLPKTISAEFFKELAEQTECVCGRSITPPVKQAILDRADSYLAEDQILVINKMKLALRESSADVTQINAVATALTARQRELRQNKMALDQLELDRIEAGDTEVERLRNEVRRVETDLEKIDAALERLTTRDTSRQRALGVTAESNLPLCEIELKRCREKHATATKTRRFVMQSECMKEILSSITVEALDKLRERVRLSTNEKLAQLVPSEKLRIAKIGGALELESGGIASKPGVSEGQSLAVAYAFLTSLLTDATYKLPFIVDSPAVSLDTKVRREVGDLIPDLFDQMIIFVISSEREGFADAFYDREGVKYLTVWRDGHSGTEVREGLPFFRTFHQLEAVQ